MDKGKRAKATVSVISKDATVKMMISMQKFGEIYFHTVCLFQSLSSYLELFALKKDEWQRSNSSAWREPVTFEKFLGGSAVVVTVGINSAFVALFGT